MRRLEPMTLQLVFTSIVIILIAVGLDWALMRWLTSIRQVEADSL